MEDDIIRFFIKSILIEEIAAQEVRDEIVENINY